MNNYTLIIRYNSYIIVVNLAKIINIYIVLLYIILDFLDGTSEN